MRIVSLLLALWVPATAQVAPMLNLVVLEGEGATNNIRQRTAREPVVQVQDENHKPVAGAIVVFTLPSNGAGGTFANGARTLSMVSDNQGRAVARGFHPNGLKGQFQIRVNATSGSLAAAIAISQTNVAVAVAGASVGSGKLIAVLVAVGAAAAAGGAYYATHNGSGTPTTTTIQPSTTIAAGTGAVGPPR